MAEHQPKVNAWIPIHHPVPDLSVEMERQSGSPEGSGRQAFKGSPTETEIAAEYVSPAKGKDTAKKDRSLYVQGRPGAFRGEGLLCRS
jgi:hypothetical protein